MLDGDEGYHHKVRSDVSNEENKNKSNNDENLMKDFE